MKKHTISSMLLALCLLLSACPQQGGTVSETPPTGAPLTQLSAFPSEHLACCWSELQKADSAYAATALGALNGDLAALEKLLGLSKTLELTPGYAHGAVMAEILQRIGDERFAWVLARIERAGGLKEKQALFDETISQTLRNQLEGGFALNAEPAVHSSNLAAYPKTAKALNYVVESKTAEPAKP